MEHRLDYSHIENDETQDMIASRLATAEATTRDLIRRLERAEQAIRDLTRRIEDHNTDITAMSRTLNRHQRIDH